METVPNTFVEVVDECAEEIGKNNNTKCHFNFMSEGVYNSDIDANTNKSITNSFGYRT